LGWGLGSLMSGSKPAAVNAGDAQNTKSRKAGRRKTGGVSRDGYIFLSEEGTPQYQSEKTQVHFNSVYWACPSNLKFRSRQLLSISLAQQKARSCQMCALTSLFDRTHLHIVYPGGKDLSEARSNQDTRLPTACKSTRPTLSRPKLSAFSAGALRPSTTSPRLSSFCR
jgi:hypothetical protein